MNHDMCGLVSTVLRGVLRSQFGKSCCSHSKLCRMMHDRDDLALDDLIPRARKKSRPVTEERNILERESLRANK